MRIVFIGKINQTNSIICDVLKTNFQAEVDFTEPEIVFDSYSTSSVKDKNFIIVDLNTSSGFGNAPENIRKLNDLTPEIPILVLDHHKEKNLIKPLIEAGASVIISSTPTEEKIAHAMEQLLSGNTYYELLSK